MHASNYKSKKGVMISPHTGGASADIREVIKSEVDFKKDFDTAIERARLESAVVEAAKTWRLERVRISGTTYTNETAIKLMNATHQPLRDAVDALLQFEQEHNKDDQV